MDLRRIESELTSGRITVWRLHLRAQPQVATVRAHVGETIERLHGRMREIGQFILHIETLGSAGERGLHVAGFTRDGAGSAQQSLILAALSGGGVAALRTLIPLDLERVASALRGPGVGAVHG